MEDQFEKKRQEKKDRVDKNKKQQKRNEDQAAASATGSSVQEMRQQRKKEIEKSVTISRTSTASLGKFDKKLDNEKLVKVKGTKRQVIFTLVPTFLFT